MTRYDSIVKTSLPARAAALSLALVADRVLGEPPASLHPVARFGQAMEGMERRVWADRRATGALYAAAGVGSAAAVGVLLSRGSRGLRIATLAGCTYVTVAGRALREVAAGVAEALDAGDLPAARGR
ncbi:MAG TPA: cobalamin biosynthesis protein, partial [Acidimicrobiales bacterium]|nr:cobalamin biosynthesis protein [Acidimicrobiales bacterium]